MLKRALGISVIILVAALVLNNMLGGFEPVQTSIVPFTDSYVYGKEYEGRYDSNELTDLVEEVRAKLSSGDLEGELVIINYFDDRKEKRGDLKQFVGAITSNPSLLNSKSNFSVLKLEYEEVVEARIEIAKLVMPSPEKIKNEAFKMSEQQGVELADFSIETYSEKELIVQFPIQY